MVTTPRAAYQPGRTRRFLLAVLLGLVVLSVVGMHQLSLGHAFATPSASFPHRHAAGQHGAAGADRHEVDRSTATMRSAVLSGKVSIGEVTGPAAVFAGVAGTDTMSGVMLTAAPQISGSDGTPGGHSCPGCGGHSMALGACLLALTLLVVSWPLLLPRTRLLPPTLRLRQARVLVVVVRRVPALSLAELSILRT